MVRRPARRDFCQPGNQRQHGSLAHRKLTATQGPERSGPTFSDNAADALLLAPPAAPPAPRPCFSGAEAPHRRQNPARSSTVEAANFTFSRDWAIITYPTPPASPPAPQPISRPLWGLEPLH
jgi:hypothetical protein